MMAPVVTLLALACAAELAHADMLPFGGAACATDADCPTTEPRQQGKKQWLMIGDSIRGQCASCGMCPGGSVTKRAAEKGIQLVKSVGNGANVWWGAHCLDAMLGADPSRWDIITYQFGLHDLALDIERMEPDTTYSQMLANITARLAAASPAAHISWVTTTPVPKGIDGPCINSTGGCPPRYASDPPLFNKASAKVIAAHNSEATKSGARQIATIDLYAVATKKCGTSYTRCPEGCTGKSDCYQLPGQVHFAPAGLGELAQAYMAAADGVPGMLEDPITV